MLSVLVGLLIRSGVILLAAASLRRVPRKLHPADRHRILLAGFGALLVWPLLPEIRVPLWPAAHVEANVTVQQTTFALGHGTAAPSLLTWAVALWVLGVSLVLARFILGYSKMQRVTRRALPLNNDTWSDTLEELCRGLGLKAVPELLMSAEPVMPLTFGLRRVRILLPEDCLTWTSVRRRTVLLHELAHVRRRDILWHIMATAVTALWWFQPLCWTSRRSLRRESERACDALVLESGVRPSEYAAELLHIAQHFGAKGGWSVAAITMARRGDLENRLCSILEVRPSQRPRKLSSRAIVFLTLLTMTASAVTLAPGQQRYSPGGFSMKRTLLSGLLASAGLSAATISGSLFDPSGAVVPNAKAVLCNPDSMSKQETATASDGKFSFENLPAGQYILRIEKPGFAALFREFKVEPDSKVDRGLMLQLGSLQEQILVEAKGRPTGYPPQTENPKQIRVGGEVEASNLVNKVNPVYPPSAKAAGIEGKVSLEMVISKDGAPQDIRVISSPNDDLTQSALEAVRQWRYTSMLLNGQPIEVITDVTVNYTLSK